MRHTPGPHETRVPVERGGIRDRSTIHLERRAPNKQTDRFSFVANNNNNKSAKCSSLQVDEGTMWSPRLQRSASSRTPDVSPDDLLRQGHQRHI